MKTWKFREPEYTGRRWPSWALPLEIDGKQVTAYGLSIQHSPFVREDSLTRWGLTPEQIQLIKKQAHEIWTYWRYTASIVQGAKI